MVPLVSQFRAAGHRMGILSNTCRSHWEYCARRYRILTTLFDVAALSFEIHAVKPERAIFLAAAELAGCDPEEIFFVDDTPGHVDGARAAGYDAVAFLSPPQLAAEFAGGERDSTIEQVASPSGRGGRFTKQDEVSHAFDSESAIKHPHPDPRGGCVGCLGDGLPGVGVPRPGAGPRPEPSSPTASARSKTTRSPASGRSGTANSGRLA